MITRGVYSSGTRKRKWSRESGREAKLKPNLTLDLVSESARPKAGAEGESVAATTTAAAASTAGWAGGGFCGAAGDGRAEDGKLDGGFFAGTLGARDFLLAVDDNFFELGFAIVADVFVDGHALVPFA